jgi:GcrA cell cycle regulator
MTYTGSASEYWPPERIEHMQLLFTEGLSARQVGERLGVSHRAVLAKCSRLGVTAGRPSQEWPPERVDRLRELATMNLTASQIGAELGITKNAALGKMHREGIERQPKNPSQKFKKGRARPQPVKIPLYDGWKAKRRSSPGSALHFRNDGDIHPTGLKDLPADVPGRAEGGLGIFDLQPDSCRYPCAGDGVAIVYCGATSVDGCSWCERHLRVVYRPRAA